MPTTCKPLILLHFFKSYNYTHTKEKVFSRMPSLFLHCKNTTTNIKEESTVLQLESERLTYREITEQDFEIVAGILRDPEVRRIWEQDFSDEEVWAWIARRQEGYRTSGIDYLLALDKATGPRVHSSGRCSPPLPTPHGFGIPRKCGPKATALSKCLA